MNICLYGASSRELESVYYDAAYEFGTLLAAHSHTLVYGGGGQGVMGAAARGVREHGGNVVGIAPRFFENTGVLYDNCTEFHFTQTMQDRKRLMMERSQAFVMAPGGIGTFEEFFEILTLKQLGRHNPAIAVFNVNGYYEPMLEMLRHTVRLGFAKPVCMDIFSVCDTAEDTLSSLESFNPDALDVRHIKNI